MIDEKEFTDKVLTGDTVKELQEYYGITRSAVYSYKKKWNLIGKTPNASKSMDAEGTRTCTECTRSLPTEQFYSNGKQPNGRKKCKSKCKSCYNKHSRDVVNNKLYRLLKESGMDYECSSCGYSKNPAALCFHHVDPSGKDFEISQMSSYSYEELRNEISKCVVLCHNCHMEEHYPHLNNWLPTE